MVDLENCKSCCIKHISKKTIPKYTSLLLQKHKEHTTIWIGSIAVLIVEIQNSQGSKAFSSFELTQLAQDPFPTLPVPWVPTNQDQNRTQLSLLVQIHSITAGRQNISWQNFPLGHLLMWIKHTNQSGKISHSRALSLLNMVAYLPEESTQVVITAVIKH